MQQEIRSNVRGKNATLALQAQEETLANYHRILEDLASGVDQIKSATGSRRPHPLDKTEVFTFSERLLERFMDAKDLEGERKLKRAHLCWLKTSIQKVPIPIEWAVANVNGVLYRLNGDHTLMLALDYPEIFEGLTIHFVTYYCASKAEASLLYEQYDLVDSKRTPSEALGPLAVTAGVQLARTKVNPFVRAILFAERGILGNSKLPVRKEVILNHLKFYYWLYEEVPEIESSGCKFLCRAANAAVMYITWSVNPMLAAKFWKAVFTGGGALTDGDPCRKLYEYCRSVKAPTNDTSLQHLEGVGAAISCWNAWYRNESVVTIHTRIKGQLPRVRGLKDTSQFKLLQIRFEAKTPSK